MQINKKCGKSPLHSYKEESLLHIIHHKENTVHQTLGFYINNDQILLGKKATGFGAGFWNGFGGHNDSNETPEQCLIREFMEESGIVVQKQKHIGVLKVFRKKDIRITIVDVFRITKADLSDLHTTIEMPEIACFPINQLPSMLPDTSRWIKHIFDFTKFTAFIQLPANDQNTKVKIYTSNSR